MLRERGRGVEGFDDFKAIRVGTPDLRAEGYVAEVDAVVNAVRNSAERCELCFPRISSGSKCGRTETVLSQCEV